MNRNATWPVAAIISALCIWSIAGCRQQPSAETETTSHEHEATSEEEAGDQAAADKAEETPEQAHEHYDATELEEMDAVLTSGSDEVRRKALKVVTDILFSDEPPDTRIAAAGALKAMPDEAAKELLQAARNDVAPEVRVAAVEALGGATGTPWLYEQLSGLRRADDATVRAAAFRVEMALRINGPDEESKMRWLAAQLGERDDDASAQTAIQMKIRGETTLPYLIDVLETGKDPVQREVAACLIGLICAGTNPRQKEFAKLAKSQYKKGFEQPGPANLEGLKPLE